MEKKIIRTNTIQAISSKIIRTFGGYEDLMQLNIKFGRDYILEKVFEETKLSYQQLLIEYNKFINDCKENSLFANMYVISPQFGVVIDAHIYLYHMNPDIARASEQLFPWVYMDSKKYLGDTWWFDDDEVLNDIQKMHMIDFLEKYKGY